MAKALSAFLQTPDLAVIDCANCAVQFAMPSRMETDRRRDHLVFYCPAGHTNYYAGKSDEEKLKEQLAAKEAEIERLNRRVEFAKNEAESERRSKIATKGSMTKLRKRVAAGVCPCCQRTFGNVARHMASKHPDFTASQA